MTTRETVHSNLAIPPGEFLEEVIEDLGMTKDELARRMGRPATKLSPIFSGVKAITPETALQLEQVVGVPAHIWTGLESEYRLTLARNAEASREAQLKEEAGMVTSFCYNELAKLGEVPDIRKPIERVRALHDFFGVTSLHNVANVSPYQAAFRIGMAGTRSPEATSAWLRLGERRGQKSYCEPYNEQLLRARLPELRHMTMLNPPEFREELVTLLAECGVALVLCPHFPKTQAHGATFWVKRDRAVLMMTLRGKYADIFWFSLFHEIGHILLHGKQAVFLEDESKDKREREADDFAAELLIPDRQYQGFLRRGHLYREDILQFAERIAIAPGIVVGRLQHDGKLRNQWCNELRVRYNWKV